MWCQRSPTMAVPSKYGPTNPWRIVDNTVLQRLGDGFARTGFVATRKYGKEESAVVVPTITFWPINTYPVFTLPRVNEVLVVTIRTTTTYDSCIRVVALKIVPRVKKAVCVPNETVRGDSSTPMSRIRALFQSRIFPSCKPEDDGVWALRWRDGLF